MPTLIISNESGTLTRHEFGQGNTSIGRHPDCKIVLSDGSTSNMHAEVIVTGKRSVIRDLNSANGTKLNGRTVVEAELAGNDKVTFGAVECEFLNEPITAPIGRTNSVDDSDTHPFGMEDGGDLGIAKTVSLFKSLDYGFLLPFRKIFNQGILRKKAVRMVMFLGLTPLAIYVAAIHFALEFNDVIWLFETYFCLFWAIYFYALVKPKNDVWKRGIGYALFTAFIGIPIVLISQNFPLIRDLYSAAGNESILYRAFGFVFGVGLVEETAKALPLIIFGLRKKRLVGVRDGLFLGFMSGLGFAAVEGFRYTLGASANAAQANVQVANVAFTHQVIEMMFRMMSGPILHGAWSGTVGWFIGLAATRQSPRWPIIAVGICLMAFLHGLYDVVSGSSFSLVVGAITILILMAYITHGDESELSSGQDTEKTGASL